MSPAIGCLIEKKSISQSAMTFELFNSVKDLSEEILDRLRTASEIHLDPNYLWSLESAGMRGFNPYIAVFKNEGEVCGFSVFQVVDMESDEPTGYLNIIPAWKLLFPKTHHTGVGIRARVLVGGDVFGTGVHLFRFDEEISEEEAWDSINKAAKAICDVEPESMDFWLIKDFRTDLQPVSSAAKKIDLTPVSSEPLMILDLDPSWKKFDDYLGAMKTKFRTKAKAAIKRSSELKMEEWDAEKTKQHSDKLIGLYHQLWKTASFRPGEINAKVIENWMEFLPEKCRLKVYTLDSEILAFQLGFVEGDVLDAILVGFNLELNRKYSLLERMLLEFVDCGIEAGVREIRYGRTAGELKSGVGAKAYPAYGMVRHGKSSLNRIVKWVGARMKPAIFPIREPFKSE